jgi:hypothetical protein
MDERRTVPLEPEAALQPQPPQGAARGLRMRPIIMLVVTFLIGAVFGAALMVLYALSLSGGARVLAPAPAPRSSAIRVQVGPEFITQLVVKDLRSTAVGKISNVAVTLAAGDQMTVHGVVQVLFGLSRPFTIVIQPLAVACQLKVHVLHADFSGIAVTAFARNFEGQIDQQFAREPSNLPGGFVYCLTSVRTQPQGLYLTYSARPV